MLNTIDIERDIFGAVNSKEEKGNLTPFNSGKSIEGHFTQFNLFALVHSTMANHVCPPCCVFFLNIGFCLLINVD